MGADLSEHFAILEREVSACQLCQLSKTRTRAVPGEGRRDADVMFIGEGPGRNEDQLGRPFVGRAGKFLDSLIDSIGLARSDVYITNIVKCRPPGNRDPLPQELSSCRPFLERQIDLINPLVIVTLGRHSLGTFFPGEIISRVHGSVRNRDGRDFFPMYHPAAALHQDKYRQTIVDDMKTLGQWLSSTLGSDREVVRSGSELRHAPSVTPIQIEKEADAEPEQLALF